MRTATQSSHIGLVHKSTLDTPLRELIIKIPVRYWSMFRDVELSRQLGFTMGMRCPNLHYVMRYIGWNTQTSEGVRLPYEYYIDHSISKVTLSDLVQCCKSPPAQIHIDRIEKCLQESGFNE